MNATILQGYYEAGLSLLPVNGIKQPTVSSWEDRKKNPVKPNGEFSGERVRGVAIVCGRVSGGLEIIDFDVKYDISGTLMKDFKELLNDDALIKKLVIQKTPSGGFHFVYKCEEIEGNKKLARRPTTDEEKEKNPKQKVAALIETRGEGGYFLVYPSEGYEITNGSILNIPVITIEERERLHHCAMSFNTYVADIKPMYSKRGNRQDDKNSPFDEFNKNFDVVAFLESEGWKVVREYSDRIALRRPGKDEGVSGTVFKGSNVFYVFSTSTEFESERGLNPVHVYAAIKCGNDLSVASHEIRKMGYGETQEKTKEPEPGETKRDDTWIWAWDGVDEYLESLRNGTFELGLSTGMQRFDQHFRYKRGNLNVVNGHDNVGKTVVLIFLMLIASLRYQWKWVIHLSENSKKSFMRKCIEFLSGQPIRGLDSNIISKWKKFVEAHFFMVDSSLYLSYEEMLRYVEHQQSKRKIDGVLIDPYNSLRPNYEKQSAKINMHQYDYETMNTFRSYSKDHDCAIYLNCHAVTSALRKVDSDGYLIAPNRADTEGGLKFASKADDFLTVHRLTNHPTDWMITDIHIRKIREMETGGMPTPKDNPLKIQMMVGGVGFVDEYGWNPILEKRFDPIKINKQEENSQLPTSLDRPVEDWTEPKKDDDLPW